MEEEPPNSLIERELEAAEKDGFSLIDGSEVDDFFISVSGIDYNFGLLDGETMLHTPEAEIPRKGERYNARKSLAWDSAFFTSDGVLDAEELSSIIEGSSGRRKKRQHLPGIRECTSKSTSGNTTLESLEADLFCDLTSPVQKSVESSHLRVPESNARKQKTEARNQTRTRKLHQGYMAKPNSPLKLSTDLKGDGKPMKLGTVREQVKKALGSRMNPSSSLLNTPAVTRSVSSIPTILSKVPRKRTAAVTGCIKSETNNTPSSTGRRITLSRGPGTGDSRTTIPKASSYSSPGSSATSSSRIGVFSTRSSVGSIYSSVSSRPLSHGGSCGKMTRTVSTPPPNSKSKIPPRFSLKGKSTPGSPPSSGYSSKQQHSPSVSPTSTRSDWSSSSSTATFSQERTVSKDCLNLRRTFSLENHASRDLDTCLTPHISCERQNESVTLPNGSTQKSLAGSRNRSNPAYAKPSRLRMPSPKMGFFDVVKPGEQTPKSQTSSIIKTSSPRGVPNKGSARHSITKATPVTADMPSHDTPRTSIARMNPSVVGRLGRKPVIPEKSPYEKTSMDVSKPTPVIIGDEKITAAVKFPESGSSSKKRIGLVCRAEEADSAVHAVIKDHNDNWELSEKICENFEPQSGDNLEALVKSFDSLSFVKDDVETETA